MDEDLSKFNLGANAEVEGKTPDGRYIIRYIDLTGKWNTIAWSEHGPSDGTPVDDNAKAAIRKLADQLKKDD